MDTKTVSQVKPKKATLTLSITKGSKKPNYFLYFSKKAITNITQEINLDNSKSYWIHVLFDNNKQKWIVFCTLKDTAETGSLLTHNVFKYTYHIYSKHITQQLLSFFLSRQSNRSHSSKLKLQLSPCNKSYHPDGIAFFYLDKLSQSDPIETFSKHTASLSVVKTQLLSILNKYSVTAPSSTQQRQELKAAELMLITAEKLTA